MPAASHPPPLLVLGYANVDVIARVPRLPGDGERVTASEIGTHPGGMAANCACAAARLGSRVRFCGNLGRDPFGEWLARDLHAHGVDTTFAARTARTTTAIVSVTPRGERAIVSEPTRYHPEGVRAALREADRPGFVYCDGYHLGWAQVELQQAKAAGHTLYCDLDGAPDTYPRDEVLALLGRVDVVQWNEKVAAALFPGEALDAATRDLARRVPTVVSTRGGDDLLLWHHHRLHAIAVPRPAAVVDTTGAGDVLAGALLHFLALGEALEDAVRQAVGVASASTGERGARLPPGGPARDAGG